jgi:hypothetical protein
MVVDHLADNSARHQKLGPRAHYHYLNLLATALLGEVCGPSSLLLLPMPACCLAAPTDAAVLLPNALAAEVLLLVLLPRLPTRLPLLGLLLLLLLLPAPSLPVRLNKLPALAAAAAAAPALAVLPDPCTGEPKALPNPAAVPAAGPAAAPSRDAPKPARALLLLLLPLPGPVALGEPASTGRRRFAIKLEPVGDCRLAELLLLLLLLPLVGLNTLAAALRAFGDVTPPAPT